MSKDTRVRMTETHSIARVCSSVQPEYFHDLQCNEQEFFMHLHSLEGKINKIVLQHVVFGMQQLPFPYFQ
jgi:hypothetical protein